MIEIKMSAKERLEAWLDAQIEFMEHTSKYNGKIYNLSAWCNHSSKTIHVSDVRPIAKIIGYDIHTEEHDAEYRKRYFMYKGYEVFNLYVDKRRKKNVEKTEITD